MSTIETGDEARRKRRFPSQAPDRELTPRRSNPLTRPMRILVQDPSVKAEDGGILTASVPVPWEDVLEGPRGHRVHVVDYDATTQTLYEPAAMPADATRLPSDAEILNDPGFHARNVYALVMRTLARFEYALGRRVDWGFRAHQLKVVPHAF